MSGSATTEKITEISVTNTGSTPVTTIRNPSRSITIQASVKRGAPALWRYFPHSQPKNWAMLYAPAKPESIAAPDTAKSIPTRARMRPICPSADCATSAPVPSSWASIPCGSRSAPAEIISAKESRPPSE